MSDSIIKKINQLKELINYYNFKSYTEDSPVVSDQEYDRLYRQLVDLETKYPEYATPDSPTRRVGAKPLERFAKVNHSYQMQSLLDVFDPASAKKFVTAIQELFTEHVCEFVVEEKIDGLSVSLTYENGLFV